MNEIAYKAIIANVHESNNMIGLCLNCGDVQMVFRYTGNNWVYRALIDSSRGMNRYLKDIENHYKRIQQGEQPVGTPQSKFIDRIKEQIAHVETAYQQEKGDNPLSNNTFYIGGQLEAYRTVLQLLEKTTDE